MQQSHNSWTAQYMDVERDDFGSIIPGDDIRYTNSEELSQEGGFVQTVNRDDEYYMVRFRSGKGEFKLYWAKIRTLSRLLTRVDINLARLALAIQELRDK